jgi:undecaprenyl-diphosphatase
LDGGKMSFIEILRYIILGIVQGISEVLPISSSGHVEISKVLLDVDLKDSLMFLIIVNTGSLVTFLVLYFKVLLRIIKGFFVYIFKKELREKYKPDFIFALKIVVASIPAAIVGLLFNDIINQVLSTHAMLLVGVGLLLTATVLFCIIKKEPFDSKDNDLSWLDVSLMGLAQSVALIPGVSRSGMTSSTALRRGKSIHTALDFSFIMYIPVSIGSTLLMVIDFIKEDYIIYSNQIILYILSFFAALVATYIAYKLIFSIFKSGKLKYFSYYCFGASAFALLIYILGN